MDAGPVRQRLAEADLGVGVVLRPENGGEDLGVASFPFQAIEHRHGVAGKVHKQLLARRVRLAHGRRHTAAPLAVPVAEPAVAVASGDTCGIRATAALASRRDGAAWHGRAPKSGRASIATDCNPLARQRRVIDVGRDGLGDADHCRPPDIPTDRSAADPDRLGNHPLAPQAYFRRRTYRTLRIGNLSAGIGPPPAGTTGKDLAPFRLPATEPASPHQQRGYLRSEPVAALLRMGWSLSVRTSPSCRNSLLTGNLSGNSLFLLRAFGARESQRRNSALAARPSRCQTARFTQTNCFCAPRYGRGASGNYWFRLNVATCPDVLRSGIIRPCGLHASATPRGGGGFSGDCFAIHSRYCVVAST